MAESETKDFDLVPTIASTGGSKKERKENTGLHLLALLRTKTLLGTLGRESHPALCPGKSAPLESTPQRPSAGPDFSTLTSFLQGFVS